VAFLAYCLTVTLKNRLQALAPGLTPKAVLEKLGAIQMLDVWLPTADGRWLVMPRYPQPGSGTGDSAAQVTPSPASTATTAHQDPTSIAIGPSAPGCGADFLGKFADNKGLSLAFQSLLVKYARGCNGETGRLWRWTSDNH